jgi:hypothetical protein
MAALPTGQIRSRNTTVVLAAVIFAVGLLARLGPMVRGGGLTGFTNYDDGVNFGGRWAWFTVSCRIETSSGCIRPASSWPWHRYAQMLNFYGAIVAFVAEAVATVIVTLVTKPKPVEQLAGLVWGVPDPAAGDPYEGYVRRWWEWPKLLGFTGLGIVLVLSIIFI